VCARARSRTPLTPIEGGRAHVTLRLDYKLCMTGEDEIGERERGGQSVPIAWHGGGRAFEIIEVLFLFCQCEVFAVQL